MKPSADAGQLDEVHGLAAPGRVRVDREPTQVVNESEFQLGLAWLVKVRWGIIAGQLLALAVAWGLEQELAYPWLLGLAALAASSNVALSTEWRRHEKGWLLPAVLVADVVFLTSMLAFSGGVANPFTVFFLVHVALAAVLLEPRLAWSVVSLTVIAFGALFVLPTEHMTMMHHHGASWSAHLVGMWIAYAIAAAFVTYFVGKVSRAIRGRDRKLAEVVKLAAQNERLATLSSFSANAAHQLGSPLATIGLAAKELAVALREGTGEASASDAELVCREVRRCREILADLSSRAGESMGEMPVNTTPARVVAELGRLLAPQRVEALRVHYSNASVESCPLVAPVETLAQMLHNLVRNAFEAHDEAGLEAPVELQIDAGERLCFHILDRGTGLPAEVRERLGEPFVTSRSEVGGLGLGVYLARAYAERTGGHLRFQSRSGGGLDVELCLARDAVGVRQ